VSISVIVATYGDPKWTELAEERAVPSTWGQNPYEIIIHHDDEGTVASSRNAAAAAALGTHLLVLDADDELAPGYVGAMERALEQAGANGKRSLFTPAVSVVRRGRAAPPTFFRECDLRQANWLVVGTLVHRDMFWEVGGFPEAEHGLEDFALWSKCVRAGAEIVKVPDAVYRYWANPNSMHRQLWRDKTKQRAAHNRVIAELDAWEAAR
jgi:glycosyltransferase involved in cell wall biosynthesis